MTRRTRVRIVVVCAAALWLATVAALMSWSSILSVPAARLALKAGIRLEFDALEFGWRSITLRGVRFALDATSIEGTAKSVRIVCQPMRIDAENVHLECPRSPIDCLLSFARWANNYPSAVSVAISAKHLDASGLLRSPVGDLVAIDSSHRGLAERMESNSSRDHQQRRIGGWKCRSLPSEPHSRSPQSAFTSWRSTSGSRQSPRRSRPAVARSCNCRRTR